VVVPPGEEAAFLAPLPIRVLPGLGPAAEKRLDGLGLRVVGDLAATPEATLQARLGSQGQALKAMAVGEDPRAVVVPGMPKSISREVTFEHDLTDGGELRHILRGLTQDVTRSLRGRRLVARTVRLKVRFAGFETHTFQATLPFATDVDAEFLEAADRLLAAALERARPVRLIGIGGAGLSDVAEESLLDHGRERHRALDHSLDLLRDRFGPAAISRGRPAPTRQLDWRRDDIDLVIPAGDEE
jgi:DNA polymerase-4